MFIIWFFIGGCLGWIYAKCHNYNERKKRDKDKNPIQVQKAKDLVFPRGLSVTEHHRLEHNLRAKNVQADKVKLNTMRKQIGSSIKNNPGAYGKSFELCYLVNRMKEHQPNNLNDDTQSENTDDTTHLIPE